MAFDKAARDEYIIAHHHNADFMHQYRNGLYINKVKNRIRGLSRNTSFTGSAIAIYHANRSAPSINSVWMPQRGTFLLKSRDTHQITPWLATTRSPASSRQATSPNTAAIPLLVARQVSATSSKAKRSSNVLIVGLP